MTVNHEPCVTYEGDNNVLMQQTSNWIFRQWLEVQTGSTIGSPLSSVTFLLHGASIINKKFTPNSIADVKSLKCKKSLIHLLLLDQFTKITKYYDL